MEFARLFTAIRPGEQTMGHLLWMIGNATAQPVRWMKAANLHLTLHFLGNVETTRIGEIRDAVASGTDRFLNGTAGSEGSAAIAADGIRPQVTGSGISPGIASAGIPLAITGVSAFPSISRPRTVVVTIADPSGKLAALQRIVGEELSARGFRLDNRVYRPHITLGYVHKRATRSEQSAVGEWIRGFNTGYVPQDHPGARFDANEVLLVRSTLGRGGSTHKPIYGTSLAPASSETSSGESARE